MDGELLTNKDNIKVCVANAFSRILAELGIGGQTPCLVWN